MIEQSTFSQQHAPSMNNALSDTTAPHISTGSASTGVSSNTSSGRLLLPSIICNDHSERKVDGFVGCECSRDSIVMALSKCGSDLNSPMCMNSRRALPTLARPFSKSIVCQNTSSESALELQVVV